MVQVILASASPRRQKLMQKLGLNFTVVPSDAAEVDSSHLTGAELAMANAQIKAATVALKHSDSLVIGADTVVSCENHKLGKPQSFDEAAHMLALLSGKTHQVITGVCLVYKQAREMNSFYELTDVTFKNLKPEQIQEYFKFVQPLDKAGGYAIQEHGDWIIDHICGSYTNVIGLPVKRLMKELKQFSRKIHASL